MAYRRGDGTVEVELARLQSWAEGTDVDLYGRDGDDLGVIREHRDARMSIRLLIWICGIFGGLIPTVLTLLTYLHLAPR